MTVEENLLLGRMSSRPGPWTVDGVVATFPNLEARRKARAGTLSGGEQQATAIVFFAVETWFGATGVWYLVGLGGAALVFALLLPKGI